MTKSFKKALQAKGEQRKFNAERPVAEKMRTLDRLRERAAQLKRAKPIVADRR